MEVAANNCVGPLSSRSHFQQILVQLTNSKLINCVSSCFVDNVILVTVAKRAGCDLCVFKVANHLDRHSEC